MKKKLVLFLTLTMTVGMLTACGNSGSISASGSSSADAGSSDTDAGGSDAAGDDSEASGGEAAEPVTIEFWNSWTGSDGDTLVAKVNEFNETNQWGITINMDISSEFSEKLATTLPTGDCAPLILSGTGDRFRYGEYLLPIDDIWENTGLSETDFNANAIEVCKTDGVLYALPFQNSLYYMYWNKDLFTAAGLNPETPPSTWDEWAEYAQKLTDESKNVYGSGISYDYAYQIAHIMQRFGGLAVTGESENWKANFEGNSGYAKFLNMYQTMVQNGDNPLEADTDSMASAGQIGMTVGGPWVTAGLDTAGVNYGIGLIPLGDAGDMNSVEVLGFSVTTAASDAEKAAAYKFIEWWNSENAEGSSPALEWSVANGFPAYTYSVQEKDAYKTNAKLSAMSAANPDAPTDFIVDSSFPGTNAIIADVIPEMINSVAFGSSSVEEALAKAQAAADKITADY